MNKVNLSSETPFDIPDSSNTTVFGVSSERLEGVLSYFTHQFCLNDKLNVFLC